VNQTRPHCVNQMGKTHSKPLAARHGRGMACYVWIGLYRLKYSRPGTHAVTNKTTAVLCNIFPLLASYSMLTRSSKLTL